MSTSRLCKERAPLVPQSMSSVGGTPDAATEKALVALLSQPLEQYGVVTTLALDSYALVLALLRPPTQKARLRC